MSHLRGQFLPPAALSCIVLCWISVSLGPTWLQAASPQDQSSEPGEIFQEQIGVEIVNIDVTVTDNKGNPIAGLTRGDFKLEVDGKEVPIANFYASSPRSVTPEVVEPLEKITDLDTLAATPLHIVVYVESFYLLPNSRQRVLRELPSFFEEQVAAGAKIMVIEHHRQSRVLAPFTDDRDQLRAALEEIEEAPTAGIHQRVARRGVMTDIQVLYESFADPCNQAWSQMINTVEQYSLAVGHERRAAMASLEDVVNALTVLEGKKVLLHVSNGIEQQAGLDLFDFLVDKLCPQKRIEISEYLLRLDVSDLNQTVNRANASRVTFYTFEAFGLRGLSSASAEFQTAAFTPSPQNDSLRFSNLQGTLHYLANETGGKAILNANKFAPDLAKLGGEFSTYYSLGYQPDHVGEGHSHRVNVKVPQNKVPQNKAVDQVRYRRGFLHKEPEHILADKAMGAVIFGVSENPLNATVRTRTEKPLGKGVATVALDVSVPYENIVLIPRRELREGRLRLILAVPDAEGKVALRKMSIPISVTAAQARGDFQFGVNLKLEAAEHHLGVSIWDEIAATGSFLSLPNPVSAALAAEPGSAVRLDRKRQDRE